MSCRESLHRYSAEAVGDELGQRHAASRRPGFLMADGNAAIWGAVRQVWPEAGEQRCWNHKMRNVLDRLPQREQSEAKDLLRAVVYAPSRAEARSRQVSREGAHGREAGERFVLVCPLGPIHAGPVAGLAVSSIQNGSSTRPRPRAGRPRTPSGAIREPAPDPLGRASVFESQDPSLSAYAKMAGSPPG